MSIKQILVDACGAGSFARALPVALGLATRFRARVAALSVAPAPLVLPIGVPGVGDLVSLDAPRQSHLKAARLMRESFLAEAKARRIQADWIQEDAQQASLRAIITHAAASDLIVTGDGEALAGRLGGASVTERLAMASGRPILVVAKEPVARTLGERTLIAWSGTRESARALHDSLPLIEAPREVHVLTVGDDQARSVAIAQSLARLRELLDRHGVTATTEAQYHSPAIAGAAILEAAAARGCDLIVLGCYGHARLGELLLGGVTRHVLRHSAIPLLMSH